jgi:hypothetical protein
MSPRASAALVAFVFLAATAFFALRKGDILPPPAPPPEAPPPKVQEEPDHPACASLLGVYGDRARQLGCRFGDVAFIKGICRSVVSSPAGCMDELTAATECLKALPLTGWKCEFGGVGPSGSACKAELDATAACVHGPAPASPP